MQESTEFILPEQVKVWIFERGGRFQSEALVDWLWKELKEKCPDADIRARQRYVGLYLGRSSKTFAKINSKVEGPVFGIPAAVADAFNFLQLTPGHFADWGGELKGFAVDENSISELLELLELSYQYNQFGSKRLNEYQKRHADIAQTMESDVAGISDQDLHIEGGKRIQQSIVSERDPKLRAKAIAIHGLKCMACTFDFEKYYGEYGKSFIEVHHNKPLGARSGPSETNPQFDLDVVCSNCHRMLHRKKGLLLTVDDLRLMIKRNADK